MKQQLSIVAVIAVAAVAALGINAYANTGFTASDSLKAGSYAIGHVELVLHDANGEVKQYIQADNEVVDVGDVCASELLFGDTGAGTGEGCSGNVFNYIGLINGTFTVENTDDVNTLLVPGTGINNGLMSVVQGTVSTPDTASVEGTDTTITNSAEAFKFTTGNNDTTVSGVVLLDNTCTMGGSGASAGECTAITTASTEMFAARTANLAVSGGDTLTVTWTITIGDAN